MRFETYKQKQTDKQTGIYDMIYLRALKSWRNGQLRLAHGTETKN